MDYDNEHSLRRHKSLPSFTIGDRDTWKVGILTCRDNLIAVSFASRWTLSIRICIKLFSMHHLRCLSPLPFRNHSQYVNRPVIGSEPAMYCHRTICHIGTQKDVHPSIMTKVLLTYPTRKRIFCPLDLH